MVRWAALCNPGESYLSGGRASKAFSINGLRLTDILAAPSARVIASELRERFNGIREESGREIEIRSFNRAFDEPFLRTIPWRILSGMWGPCLMIAAQNHMGMWKWPKLHEAVDYLGIVPPVGRSHTAAVDSHAGLLVHEKLLARPSR